MKERLPDTPEKPLHPWRERLENLPEGKGNFYYWGANYTVDPIVMTNEPVPRVLLIQRRDNGKWALPGGFIDENENPVAAGLRELEEETGLQLNSTEPTIVYAGPVEDYRATMNAWPETIAMLWQVATADELVAGDDAQLATWVYLDELPEELHGSHLELITRALAMDSAC